MRQRVINCLSRSPSLDTSYCAPNGLTILPIIIWPWNSFVAARRAAENFQSFFFFNAFILTPHRTFPFGFDRVHFLPPRGDVSHAAWETRARANNFPAISYRPALENFVCPTRCLDARAMVRAFASRATRSFALARNCPSFYFARRALLRSRLTRMRYVFIMHRRSFMRGRAKHGGDNKLVSSCPRRAVCLSARRNIGDAGLFFAFRQ